MPMPDQHQKPLRLSPSPVTPWVTLSHTSCFLCSTLLASSYKKAKTFLSIRWDFLIRNASSLPGGPSTEAIKLCVEAQLGMAKQDIRAVLMEKSTARACHTREAISSTG